MARTDDRDRYLKFSEIPVYETYYQFAVRSEDVFLYPSVGAIVRDSENEAVLLTTADTNEGFLKSAGIKRIDAGAGTVTENLKKLIAQRGRWYFASSLSLKTTIKRKGFASAVAVLPLKLIPTKIYIVFSSRAQPGMVAQINAGMAHLAASGELERIRLRYMGIGSAGA